MDWKVTDYASTCSNYHDSQEGVEIMLFKNMPLKSTGCG